MQSSAGHPQTLMVAKVVILLPQSSKETVNEFEKLKTSPHFATLLKLAEYAKESILALASDSDLLLD